MALEKKLYTAHATTTGGRSEGNSKTDDGKLQVKLSSPKETGGSGDGTNPEQLFAIGYSACFLGTMKAVAAKQKTPIPAESKIDADVSFGPLAGGAKGNGIEVAMAISVPGWERAKTEALVAEAHQLCAYSNATRGNIVVALNVV